MNAAEQQEPPRRVRAPDVAVRYGITERLAGEWLRAAVAAGVVRKMGRGRAMVVRWTTLDAWVENGGTVTGKRRTA